MAGQAVARDKEAAPAGAAWGLGLAAAYINAAEGDARSALDLAAVAVAHLAVRLAAAEERVSAG